MNLKYYKNLDGTRGIAALMVVFFHFFTYPNSLYLENLNFYQKIFEFGQHGVSLFFVLSGFVITRILIHTKSSKDYFYRFYKRRILRIFPLYYFFLFVFYLFPLVIGEQTVNFKQQLPFYFYLQNLTNILNIEATGPPHYWSLAVEEHFYMIWPLVLFFIDKKHLGKLILLYILFTFFLKYYMLNEGITINKFTLTRMDQIMMGSYLAILEIKGFFKEKYALKKMIGAGLLIVPIAVATYLLSGVYPFAKEMFKYPILGILFFSIIGSLICMNERNLINRILSSSLFQYLGKISYGIYVWHILVLIFLYKFFSFENLLVDLVLTIGLTILLAHLSYYYFEVYFLKLKDKSFELKKQEVKP